MSSKKRVSYAQINAIGCDNSENGCNHALLIADLQIQSRQFLSQHAVTENPRSYRRSISTDLEAFSLLEG